MKYRHQKLNWINLNSGKISITSFCNKYSDWLQILVFQTLIEYIYKYYIYMFLIFKSTRGSKMDLELFQNLIPKELSLFTLSSGSLIDTTRKIHLT